jgi:hypothetical protein
MKYGIPIFNCNCVRYSPFLLVVPHTKCLSPARIMRFQGPAEPALHDATSIGVESGLWASMPRAQERLTSNPAPLRWNASLFLAQSVRTQLEQSNPVCSILVTHVCATCRVQRKIPRGPFKVLDAPSLQDDFYLNLVDWSTQNVLAVGLGSCVYLWSACTCKVTKLVDLAPNDMVCSVAWSQRGTYLSVGTSHADTQIFDVSKLKLIRSMEGHRARVGTMAWNSHLLSTGSRDRTILQRDVRVANSFVQRYDAEGFTYL